MPDAYTPRRRSIRFVVAAIALSSVALLTLVPQRFVGPVRWGFFQMADAVAAPVLDGLTNGDAERILNTLLFVPLGAALALLLARRWWILAVVAGFALSATVEYAQASIPGRVPDPADILWNTLGGAIGVVVVTMVRVVAAAVRRARGARRRRTS